MPHENFLAGSFYGKFFARHLHLTLLRRKPDEWKKMQMHEKNNTLNPGAAPSRPQQQPYTSAHVQHSSSVATPDRAKHQAKEEKVKKRKREDVIEDIFETKHTHKNTSAKPEQIGRVLSSQPPTNLVNSQVLEPVPKIQLEPADKSMADILGAIREVPKGTAVREGKRHKKGKA